LRQARAWADAGHQILLIPAAGAPLAEVAACQGVAAAPQPMRHDVSPAAVLRLAGALRRFRPDVVLCCNERAFRLAAVASSWVRRIPILYRCGLSGTFKNRAHNRLLGRRLTRVVANAPALAEEIAAYGWIPRERIVVIPNGIDLSLYGEDPPSRARIRDEMGVAEEACAALMLGRLHPEKGHETAIRALREVRREHPGACLWIAGSGSLGPELCTLVERMALGDAVRFLGERDDVPALLQAADLLLQPSQREGLSNAVLEAMAAARPVIASAVGGLPDLLREGECGRLTPPGDADALAREWSRVAGDPVERRELGRRARERAAGSSLAAETQKWCDLFAEVSGR
jgi:glycosyltransferase involved in cell wall biosynthesis